MTIEGERRTGARIPVEMWVEESTERELYFQRSANLSVGGIYLENAIPHPVGTRINIKFTLPGDTLAIEAGAEIVNTSERETPLGMGLKFLELRPELAERIRAFVASRDPR